MLKHLSHCWYHLKRLCIALESKKYQAAQTLCTAIGAQTDQKLSMTWVHTLGFGGMPSAQAAIAQMSAPQTHSVRCCSQPQGALATMLLCLPATGSNTNCTTASLPVSTQLPHYGTNIMQEQISREGHTSRQDPVSKVSHICEIFLVGCEALRGELLQDMVQD